jgi:hypothetical protein
MTDHSKYHSPFTAKDIERYYAGTMSPEEMHKLEKEALDDAFLADALEGYAFTQQPVRDIEELQKKLNNRTETTKAIPFGKTFSLSFAWKAVAMIILVLGIGWAVYQFSFNANEKDLAVVNKKEERKVEQQSTSASTTPENDSALKEQAAQVQKTDNTRATNSYKTTTATTRRNKKKANNEPQIGSIVSEQSDSDQAEDQKALNEVAIAPRRTFNYDVATPDKDVRIRGVAKQRMEDTPVVVGYGTQRKSDVTGSVIVLEKDTTNPVQELVVGKSIPDSLRSKPHIAFTNVEPEEGSDFYDDYITHNLSIPEEIKTKKTSGEVELSFEINDEGKAVNIKVEKSLCEACDKEAIRLVQEGPKLKKKNKQKGKLKIRF